MRHAATDFDGRFLIAEAARAHYEPDGRQRLLGREFAPAVLIDHFAHQAHLLLIGHGAYITPMPMLSPTDVAVLREACRAGVLKIKVAGRISEAEKAREFERCKSATVLRYLGFLEELPDEGAYASWRPVRGCAEALASVMAERRPISRARRA